MLDHVCACRGCDPRLDPDTAWLGEHHAAVRFPESRPFEISVFVEGFETKLCYEAIAGERGTAWLIRNPVHACLTCRAGEACCHKVAGEVRIERCVSTAHTHETP